jgi:hypothetical protein
MPFRRSRYGFSSTVKSYFMSREMAFYILRSLHLNQRQCLAPKRSIYIRITPYKTSFIKISSISFTFGGNIHVISIVRGEGKPFPSLLYVSPITCIVSTSCRWKIAVKDSFPLNFAILHLQLALIQRDRGEGYTNPLLRGDYVVSSIKWRQGEGWKI